ncbi:DUF5655 domain-containing protein [Chryseolinea sp. T2]|uniref:DUF5655 domain-containing protein n=1 Tax=Chryseolinea sp. T2 TaxID=3129255 RepID=UPI003077EF1A
MKTDEPQSLEEFIAGKPVETVTLFHYFVDQFSKFGSVKAIPAKTMIGIATPRKRIAYVTRIGKDFVHIVIPFEQPYTDNLCFEKIAQVPGDAHQFNHHLRIKRKQDINSEVLRFMKMAYDHGV